MLWYLEITRTVKDSHDPADLYQNTLGLSNISSSVEVTSKLVSTYRA